MYDGSEFAATGRDCCFAGREQRQSKAHRASQTTKMSWSRGGARSGRVAVRRVFQKRVISGSGAVRWRAAALGCRTVYSETKRSFCTPKLPRRCRRLRVSGRCRAGRPQHETRPNGWVRAPWGRGLGVQNRRVVSENDLGASGGPRARSCAPFSPLFASPRGSACGWICCHIGV